MGNNLNARYLPILMAAILALLFALWAGLLRLGWALPAIPNLAMGHGPLMVSGFLGVLIPLERAVALRRRWLFLVPVLSGIGWISLLVQPIAGALLMTAGSAGTLAILAFMLRREPHLHTLSMAGGALCWLVGNILWMLEVPIYQLVFFWLAFLVLTITGERLELNRVLNLTRGQTRLFVLASAALPAGALLALFDLDLGARLCGTAMLALALWSVANDLSRRNLRHPAALTRYIAVCLFGGFLWLGAAGGLYLAFGGLSGGPVYDAALHAAFVGFVFAMIFGHAPIIFPAILGAPLNFKPAFYLHLALLHLSLLMRLAGDLAPEVTLRQWGGMLNAVAILLFLVLTAGSIASRPRGTS